MALKHEELTEKIIGVFYDVYNELGYGFLESVYENSMMIALEQSGLNWRQQASIVVAFRNQVVGDYKADILVEDDVILELKCVKKITDTHMAQALNYLKATQIEIGLVLNFGPKPEFKRLIFDQKRSV